MRLAESTETHCILCILDNIYISTLLFPYIDWIEPTEVNHRLHYGRIYHKTVCTYMSTNDDIGTCKYVPNQQYVLVNNTV